MTDDKPTAASDGGVCMIDRTAKASQHGDTFQPARNHKTTCAGCDCEPGTTCDSQKRCTCGRTKTSCDADINTIGTTCCKECQHIYRADE